MLGVLLLVFACSKSRKPAGILSRDQMVQTLMEVYVAEDKVNKLALRTDSAQKVFGIFKEKIYAQTGTTDSLFRVSFNYYLDRPAEMEKIYNALVDSLNLREQRSSTMTEPK